MTDDDSQSAVLAAITALTARLDAQSLAIQELNERMAQAPVLPQPPAPVLAPPVFDRGRVEPAGNGGGNHRNPRLDFPKFSGTDPAVWLQRANQFFAYYQTPQGQKVLIASYYMEGRAAVWTQEFQNSGIIPSWTDFVSALQTRFGPGLFEDPMEELMRLRQVGTVDDYILKFEELVVKIQGLTEAHKLSCFLGGLKEEIRLPVKMLMPQSILAAQALARMQEETLQATKH
ncbi:uncharacterized protein LOC120014224 [Tripterygium wilfordii]|uniref:uncharacterized protein LOC120014224 n=1 Tax=Tripterygium wilfordii TaxID=458696 RepID=UPI0018F7F963|nr:uncharacterized protein LOC120014224 [Tripterygium wilfordii]